MPLFDQAENVLRELSKGLASSTASSARSAAAGSGTAAVPYPSGVVSSSPDRQSNRPDGIVAASG